MVQSMTWGAYSFTAVLASACTLSRIGPGWTVFHHTHNQPQRKIAIVDRLWEVVLCAIVYPPRRVDCQQLPGATSNLKCMLTTATNVSISAEETEGEVPKHK